MNNAIDTTALLSTTAATGAQPAAAPNDAQRGRIKELAQQFESMLVSQMLREMRKSMWSDEEEEGGLGAGAFNDSINSQLGLALSRSGGFGLAEILKRAIDKGLPPDNAAAPTLQMPSLDLGPDVTQALQGGDSGAESHGLQMMPSGQTTSPFGWRADPMTGQASFHAGRDIRMAYGQDVHSAAGGTVTFAGERSGYGTTVEVDHGGGVVTRYAHLSAPAVAVGQQVEPGQVIASSGNSGRSTGPHLHFEVLKNGQPVDPEAAIQGFSQVADSQTGRVLRGAKPAVS